MNKGLRAKLHFYEDYSGYSEEELNEKLKALGIDIDSFSNYNGGIPVHEYKSLIIQNKLFKLKDKEIETCYCLLKEKRYKTQEERQKYEESINSLLDEKIKELNKLKE